MEPITQATSAIANMELAAILARMNDLLGTLGDPRVHSAKTNGIYPAEREDSSTLKIFMCQGYATSFAAHSLRRASRLVRFPIGKRRATYSKLCCRRSRPALPRPTAQENTPARSEARKSVIASKMQCESG